MVAGMFGMKGVMSRTGAVLFGLMATGRAIVAAGTGLRDIGDAADFCFPSLTAPFTYITEKPLQVAGAFLFWQPASAERMEY